MNLIDLRYSLDELRALGDQLSDADNQCLLLINSLFCNHHEEYVLSKQELDEIRQIVDSIQHPIPDVVRIAWSKFASDLGKMRFRELYHFLEQLLEIDDESLPGYDKSLKKYVLSDKEIQYYKEHPPYESLDDDQIQDVNRCFKERFSAVKRTKHDYFFHSKLNNILYSLAEACARDPRINTSPIFTLIPTLNTFDSSNKSVTLSELPLALLTEDEKTLYLVQDYFDYFSTNQVLRVFEKLVQQFLPSSEFIFPTIADFYEFAKKNSSALMISIENFYGESDDSCSNLKKFLENFLSNYVSSDDKNLNHSEKLFLGDESKTRAFIESLLYLRNFRIKNDSVHLLCASLRALETEDLSTFDHQILKDLSEEYGALGSEIMLTSKQKTKLIELLHARYTEVRNTVHCYFSNNLRLNQVWYSFAQTLAMDIEINDDSAQLLIPGFPTDQCRHAYAISKWGENAFLLLGQLPASAEANYALLKQLFGKLCFLLGHTLPDDFAELNQLQWSKFIEGLITSSNQLFPDAKELAEALNELAWNLNWPVENAMAPIHEVHRILVNIGITNSSIQSLREMPPKNINVCRRYSLLEANRSSIAQLIMCVHNLRDSGLRDLVAAVREQISYELDAIRHFIYDIEGNRFIYGGSRRDYENLFEMYCPTFNFLFDRYGDFKGRYLDKKVELQILQELKANQIRLKSWDNSFKITSLIAADSHALLNISAFRQIFSQRWSRKCLPALYIYVDKKFELPWSHYPEIYITNKPWVELAQYLSKHHYIEENWLAFLMPNLKNTFHDPISGQKITDFELDQYVLSDSRDYLINLDVAVRGFESGDELVAWYTLRDAAGPQHRTFSVFEKRRVAYGARKEYGARILQREYILSIDRDPALKRATVQALIQFTDAIFKPSTISHNDPSAIYTKEEAVQVEVDKDKLNSYLETLKQDDPEEFSKLMQQRLVRSVQNDFTFKDLIDAVNDQRYCFGVIGWEFVQLILEYEPSHRFPNRVEEYADYCGNVNQTKIATIRGKVRQRNYSDQPTGSQIHSEPTNQPSGSQGYSEPARQPSRSQFFGGFFDLLPRSSANSTPSGSFARMFESGREFLNTTFSKK